LAAAALYALDHHVARLAEDHANARRLAAGIGRIGRFRLEPEQVDTNLVFFDVDPALGSAGEFAARLKERGLLTSVFSATRLRAVTHLDVSGQDVDRALEILKEAAV
jgi:threonine aldolase